MKFPLPSVPAISVRTKGLIIIVSILLVMVFTYNAYVNAILKGRMGAIEEIKRHSGTQFDPMVVEAFLAIPRIVLRSLMEGVGDAAGNRWEVPGEKRHQESS